MSVELYSIFDLLEDLYHILKNSRDNVIVMNLDDLLIRIRNRHHKRIGLETIRKKIYTLRRAGYVKIISRRRCDIGICYNEQARIIIRKSVIMTLAPTTRTLSLEHYMRR